MGSSMTAQELEKIGWVFHRTDKSFDYYVHIGKRLNADMD